MYKHLFKALIAEAVKRFDNKKVKTEQNQSKFFVCYIFNLSGVFFIKKHSFRI